MKAFAILLALTPSFVHVSIRRLMGASIGRGSRIKFGTILMSKQIKIGKGSKLGPFAFISGESVEIGDATKIKILSAVSARIIQLGSYVHVSPLAIITGDHTIRSIFKVGNHSRFFPFCWIDTGEGVEIGNHVGIGGHTLIFTHGVWSDYIDGGPVEYGPVKIDDGVWLPWRVFIMPNVTIGENAIIGANSTVNKSIPKNVVAAGSPAKVVKEGSLDKLSIEERKNRAYKILQDFSESASQKSIITNGKFDNGYISDQGRILIDATNNLRKNDLVLFINENPSSEQISKMKSDGISFIHHSSKTATLLAKNKMHNLFIEFIRKYGIRLNIN